MSPDGNSVVIATERPDWDQQIFRSDYGCTKMMPGSRSNLRNPAMIRIPDGRPMANGSRFSRIAKPKQGSPTNPIPIPKTSPRQIYLISTNGGEAVRVTQGEEDVHAFSWSTDSQKIYFSTRQPWSKSQKDDYKQQWKDVVQYRTGERGDTISSKWM